MRIGAWRADPNLDQLSCDMRVVKLEPRAMRLLLYLAANRNRVVALAEMLEEIWPKVVVTSQSVYSTIAQLRQILGDSADSPRYIATVPRKGYRLIADVAEWTEAADIEPTAPEVLVVAPVEATEPALPIVQPDPPSGGGAKTYLVMAAGALAAAGLAVLVLNLHRLHVRRAQVSTSMPVALPISVAVLPFLDLSEKKDLGYFSDGLTEELIDLLAHNDALRVPARTSSFYFKGKAEPVAEIAGQLHVANLLEGSVRRSGSTVRVTTQLIRAADGYHLWSETYDRDDADALVVEDDIAGKVAETLRAKLTPRAPLGKAVSLDAATRNLLLECQFYVARNTPEDTLKSVACFQKAVASNPKNPRGWSGLANALLRKPNIVDEPEGARRDDKLAAVQAAHRALQIDPNTAAAHAALAQYLMSSEYNWAAARQELDAALKSDPNDPLALLAAARLAEYLGNTQELIALCGLAQERDPLNFLPSARLWVAYMSLGRYRDAEAAARRRLDISPDGGGGHTDLALALLMQGRIAEARAEAAHEHYAPLHLWDEAMTLQAMGRRAEADVAFQEMTERYGDTDPMKVAQLAAFRGDNDHAFAALNAGVSAGRMHVYLVKLDFLFNALRADPRYHLLLRRMRLPD